MTILTLLSKHQRPCVVCGKDAFIEQGGRRPTALTCRTCRATACLPCSAITEPDGLRTLVCPKCGQGGTPTYMDPSLMENSVKTMPPQSLDGWPDLHEILYVKMIDHVADHLPVIKHVLKDLIPPHQMPAVVERLCFALATGKYMEWCYNRQDEVRSYTHSKPRPDFPAPDLTRMVELIRAVMAERGPL